MSLFFNKMQRGNPSKPEEPKKWYVVLKSVGRISEKQVAKEIADETTLNPKEAEMALYQFEKIMLRSLLDGKTVQLGELGSFQLTINSAGVDTEAEVTAKLVQKINLRFLPSTTVKEALAKATFVAAEKI